MRAGRCTRWPVDASDYLDIARADPLLPAAAKVWIADQLDLFENAAPLPSGAVTATRISLPKDGAFRSYEAALAHFRDPQLTDTDLIWKQAMLDVQLEYTITSDHSRFSMRPSLARLGLKTTTLLRFLPPGRSERAFEYIGDPGLVRVRE